MRTTCLLAAVLLASAATVRAQDAAPAAVPTAAPATSGAPEVAPVPPPTGSTGSIDIGLRDTSISGDPSHIERYRDLRDGLVAGQITFEQRGEGWLFQGNATRPGYDDQRFNAAFRAGGKVKMLFRWDQVPLNVSGVTMSPYTVDSSGAYRIADSLQHSIQTGLLPASAVTSVAQGVALSARRDTANFTLIYTPIAELNATVNLRETHRTGNQAFGASFGFSNAVEIPAPIDTHTTDVTTAIEYANHVGMLRVAYDGSWFDQGIASVVWDNPLTLTDAASSTGYSTGTAGSQGRAALPPSNTMQGVTTAGALKLAGNTRLSANVTLGEWRQNAALLPATINTSVPTIPLPRSTTDGDARTTAQNYVATSQPSQYLWLHAAYRSYDYDNRTPVFQSSQIVVLDQTVSAGEASTPYSYKRQTMDVDAALLPVPLTSFRVGYTREIDDHTYRIFDRTTEETYRSSIDLGAGTRVLVRGIIERSHRIGSHLDEELLADLGEQPSLQHYDVADRDRDRATGLLQITASKYFGVSASAAMGKDDYFNSGMGLRNNDNYVYTVSADASAGKVFDGTVSWSHERYTALQNSRTANPGTPQVTDPTRDWSIDSSDLTDTWSANAMVRPTSRLDMRIAYDYVRASAAYVYGVPDNSTIPALVQLPTIHNERHTATADVRIKLTRNLGFGVFYWYEKYTVADFAFAPATVGQLSTTGGLFLGDVFLPYTANSGAVRLIVSW
ncbi:MAG TPA: MtrB/PioB family outer membrane beta-barrel protein [Vicinamibacterales bacterium]|nr:MtrB/PioB family outer membrane beta-barrel protein [Vicinamibacterales bacterium]